MGSIVKVFASQDYVEDKMKSAILNDEVQDQSTEQMEQALNNIGVYKQSEEPYGAAVGALWIDTSDEEGGDAEEYVPISGGTMEGALVAAANPDITVAQVLNIQAGVEDLVPGESSQPTGHIYIKYEV